MNREEIGVSNPLLRNACLNDGAAIWELVRDSGSLDLNSPYAYLMLCQNFSETCVVAEMEGRLAGMVLAYRLPQRANTVFVWQIGVAHAFRGRGLGLVMLRHLVAQAGRPAASHLETTITPSNGPSQALFRAFARSMNAPVARTPWLSDHVFPGQHEAEDLFTIGPFHQEERQ